MANARIGSQAGWSFNCVETISENKVLTPGDSGKVFMIDKTASISDITLPAMSTKIAGWNCKFIMNVIGSSKTANVKAHADDQDTIHIREVLAVSDEASTGGADKDYFTFSASSVKGDQAEVMTDGTSWFVITTCTDEDNITATG